MTGLKFAFRQLLKNPGFTAVAPLTPVFAASSAHAIERVASTATEPRIYPAERRAVIEAIIPRSAYP